MQNQEAVIQEGFSSVRHRVSLLEQNTLFPRTPGTGTLGRFYNGLVVLLFQTLVSQTHQLTFTYRSLKCLRLYTKRRGRGGGGVTGEPAATT